MTEYEAYPSGVFQSTGSHRERRKVYECCPAAYQLMRRMSVDCDCAGTSAAEPTIPDIGILASTDLLAVDQASCDLVYASAGNHDLVERIESRRGLHQLEYMRELKMGSDRYALIEI